MEYPNPHISLGSKSLLPYILLLTSISYLTSTPVFSQASENKPLYLDYTQPVEKRVDDLVSRMTLEEKISQMVNSAVAIPRMGIPEYELVE